MKIKYILVFIFLSFSHQLLPAEKPLSPAEKQFLQLCKTNDLPSVEKFLEQHPTMDINTKYEHGNTALHIICNTIYHNEEEKRQADKIATLLIQKGANPNFQTGILNSTPLHLACTKNIIPLIKILINNGTNVNTKDGLGQTALHLLCLQAYNNIKEERQACEIIEMFIKKGANLNLQSWLSDSTPLLYACLDNSKLLIKILINNGANTAIKSMNFKTPYNCIDNHHDIRNEFSSEPVSFGLIYSALFDSSNQKNILATSLLPDIAHIIKNFYLNLWFNNMRAEAWIWEPVCIEACAEAYEKEKIELDNVKDLQQCLARVLFWSKEKKLNINAILHEKKKIQ